ncbi:MAG: PQQ-binding-like beta-propeller repeat protein [Candidatus Micrarchaeota archaeon]|nr:PQQ-binding-like beta-propeller repeat protein [Candidatus Micrarchaeota archaeon]
MKSTAPAIFLLFLILSSVSFASVQWSYTAQGAIIGKPLLVSDKVVFSTYEGKAYEFSADRGSISWAYDADERISVPAVKVSPDTIAVASQSGRLSFLSATGKEGAVVHLPSAPLYLAGDSGNVYVSLPDGVRAYSQAGVSVWNVSLPGPAGPIGAFGDTVYFTSGRLLYSIAAKNGAQNFAVPAEDSFLSMPLEYEGSIYFGATDGRLYSFDAVSGRQRWYFQTGGWVQSTPVRFGDSIFFGSNDGYFYSITDSGKLRFKYKTGEGIWSEPVLFSGKGGQQVSFGSNDGNIYGLDAISGEIVWSFSAGGRPGSAAGKGDNLFFGTSMGKFYSLSPSPMCSFSWPRNGASVGDWPIDVDGTAYSDSGVQDVEVRLEGGNWQPANGLEDWRAKVDFTGQPFGAYRVECRVTDLSGKQQSADYSSITLVKGQSVPLQKMSVLAPSEAGINETITISARDSRGVELTGVALSVGGVKEDGDSPFSVVLGKSGSVPISIEKPGYEPVPFVIIGTGGDNFLIPILALVALCALGFFAYRKFVAKKK